MKKVLIIGASGLIGKHLIDFALTQHWEITTFSYTNKLASNTFKKLAWNPKSIIQDDYVQQDLLGAFNQADVIINMAGESVAKGRLGKQLKQRVLQSRIESTAALVKMLNMIDNKNKTWIQMSGSTYYGSQKDQIITEESKPVGNLFLTDVSTAWEAAVNPVRKHVKRLVILRMGLVISKDSPAFQRIILPILLCSGGPLASGKQYWPWVHIDDVINSINFLIKHDHLEGVFNIGSPNPETQLDFTKKIGKAYKRPVIFPNLPAWFLRLVAGNAIDELVVPSQRMLPSKLIDAGYQFKYSVLEDALNEIKS